MRRVALAVVVLMAAVIAAFTVRITVPGGSGAAKPGSPSYGEPLTSPAIPPVPPKFAGDVQSVAGKSTAWWPPTVVPPKGAPNVLLIMTDDVGFGAPSTFGGVIPTPTLDRVASMGLRYTQFHTTSLCSPTRAALLTGRNHHSVGFGVISEMATGYPGYNSILPRDKATVGTILRDSGYSTSWFGKNHNTPAFEASQAGPFDQWPIGMGFEYFFGFVGGDTSQWQPNLFRGTTPIQPYLNNPGWNLTTAMADDAIAHIRRLHETVPDKPFFVHYTPGGTHAPHHPSPEWISKFRGQFSGGWNALRETIFENQKKLGVIPKDAVLTPWPDVLPKWDSLSADEKKLFERQVEVYAAYLAYTDHEIGRVIDAIEGMGKLDDTLVVYISGDNGASAEGSPIGTPNEVAQFNSVAVPVAEQLARSYADWGTERTYGHMAVGWSWAFSTPYKWTKQVASHFGGTRNGMAMAWPRRITDKGGIRGQFHHVIDVVPTILEATGVKAPATVDGIPQAPIEGVSMAYTWDKAQATAASARKTQYFEMFGNRGIYHEGWYANTRPTSPPWALGTTASKDVMNGYEWELYDLTKDWTQSNDLAGSNPAKLGEMKDLFLEEAAKYQVFPLDDSRATRMVAPRPSLATGRSKFTYLRPLTGIPMGDAPQVLGTSYTVRAEVEVSSGGEGILATQGGRFGGWGFYLLKGRPVYVWNLLDRARERWEGSAALAPGKHVLEFAFSYEGRGFATLASGDSSGLGRGGTGVLKVDGRVVATRRMERTIPVTLQWDESFDVGSDTGTPVDDRDYKVPFAFTGKLAKLVLTLQGVKP